MLIQFKRNRITQRTPNGEKRVYRLIQIQRARKVQLQPHDQQPRIVQQRKILRPVRRLIPKLSSDVNDLGPVFAALFWLPSMTDDVPDIGIPMRALFHEGMTDSKFF